MRLRFAGREWTNLAKALAFAYCLFAAVVIVLGPRLDWPHQLVWAVAPLLVILAVFGLVANMIIGWYALRRLPDAIRWLKPQRIEEAED